MMRASCNLEPPKYTDLSKLLGRTSRKRARDGFLPRLVFFPDSEAPISHPTKTWRQPAARSTNLGHLLNPGCAELSAEKIRGSAVCAVDMLCLACERCLATRMLSRTRTVGCSPCKAVSGTKMKWELRALQFDVMMSRNLGPNVGDYVLVAQVSSQSRQLEQLQKQAGC